MAPLILISCPSCGGDAYFEDEYGAYECTTCNATGQVEVCGCCREVPTVIGGFEVCGCVSVELGMAA